MRRIGLGTVQFGMDYGISNNDGLTPAAEVQSILGEAADMGIRMIDTAAIYGESEAVLGRSVPERHEFQIVTKTAPIEHGEIRRVDADRLRDTFYRSLELLGQSKVYGLLVHKADNLLADDNRYLWNELCNLRDDRVVDKIGVSVYTAAQIDGVLDRFDINLVQLPLNVFDQRLLRSGHLQKLKDCAVEIHVRSAFLQGLLLMKPEDLPVGLKRARPFLSKYNSELDLAGVRSIEAALDFVLSVPQIDRVIVGVCNVSQLMDIRDAVRTVGQHYLDYADFAVNDELILNPAKWE